MGLIEQWYKRTYNRDFQMYDLCDQAVMKAWTSYLVSLAPAEPVVPIYTMHLPIRDWYERTFKGIFDLSVLDDVKVIQEWMLHLQKTQAERQKNDLDFHGAMQAAEYRKLTEGK